MSLQYNPECSHLFLQEGNTAKVGSYQHTRHKFAVHNVMLGMRLRLRQ